LGRKIITIETSAKNFKSNGELDEEKDLDEGDPDKKYEQIRNHHYGTNFDNNEDECDDDPYPMPEEEKIYSYRCLRAVFGREVVSSREGASVAFREARPMRASKTGLKVTLVHFNAILQWFGPLNGPKYKKKCKRLENKMDIRQRVMKMLSCKYFHGQITSDEAKQRLMVMNNPCFLIRLSCSQLGGFVFSRVFLKEKKTLVFEEGKFYYAKGKGFTLDKIHYVSKLETVLKKIGIKVSDGCENSVFVQLFELFKPGYDALISDK